MPTPPTTSRNIVLSATAIQRQLMASLNTCGASSEVSEWSHARPRAQRKRPAEDIVKEGGMQDEARKTQMKNVYFGTDHESWRQRWRVFEDRGDCRCAICYDYLFGRPQILLPCAHVFHKTCYQTLQRLQLVPRCPVCRGEGEGKEGQWGNNLSKHCASLVLLNFAVRVLCWHGQPPLCARVLPENERQEIGLRLSTAARLLLATQQALDDETDAVLRESRLQSKMLREAERELMARVRMGTDWARVEQTLRSRIQTGATSICPVCLEHFVFARDDGIVLGADFDPKARFRFGPRSRTPVVLSCCCSLVHYSCLMALTSVTNDITDLCPLCRQGWVGRELHIITRRWL